MVRKNIIYTEKIHPAVYKMCEIMIHRFKFNNFDVSHEDVKHEVITFIHERLHKFIPGEYKAFSYFSIVAKNYLITENNKNFYNQKKKLSDGTDSIDSLRNVVNEELRKDYDSTQREFMDIFVDIVETNIDSIFSRRRDIHIADSILYLFKIRHNIEEYNKKALYILVKERTGVSSSQHITTIIKKIKFIYSRLYSEYDDGVDIMTLPWCDIEDIILD